MAPSRGSNSLLRARIRLAHSHNRRYSDFALAAASPSNLTQVYKSQSLDPYLNLSIEHFLLQRTPPQSTVLFLYTNRPSIIIGRNQNPWLEVNLGLVRSTSLGAVVVRRRSGGGTVFHDEGNVNYSVICPTVAFNRDKHARMVVRALQGLGAREAEVNSRHDIVLRKGGTESRDPTPLKVSGSAYKLTRLRSLHHGTCLLSSPNIGSISQYLRSPARPFIKARGVDSFSSPITNVDIPNESFEEAVIAEFRHLYGVGETTVLTESAIGVPEVSKGFNELTSPDWIYSQTPQFTFSTQKTEDDPRERPSLSSFMPSSVGVFSVQSDAARGLGDMLTQSPQFSASFKVRNGTMVEVDIRFGGAVAAHEEERINSSLLNRKLHEIECWEDAFNGADDVDEDQRISMRASQAGMGMDMLLGTGDAWSRHSRRKGDPHKQPR